MTTHNFVLILNRPIDEATSDLLFEAGLDDAAVTAFDGHPALDVDRDAPTLLEAIASATTQAETVAGIRVLRVEGEELVSQADIAERTGRSRQAVNHWIKRDANSSGFPQPAHGASSRSPLWRWTDVQDWLGGVAAPMNGDESLPLPTRRLLLVATSTPKSSANSSTRYLPPADHRSG